MNVRRLLLIGGAAALAGLAAAALVVRATLDGVVQRGLETRGSALAGTAVRVDAVAIALGEGRATVRGLHVANPPGYGGPDALSIGEATVALRLTSLLGDPIHVTEVRLDGVRVFYEVDANGRANIDVIRRHVERAHRAEPPRAAVTPADGTPAPRRDGGRGGGRRYVIDLLALHDGQVQLDTRATGGGTRRESLEGFELTGIGADGRGATGRQVAQTVVTALVRDVAISLAATEVEKFLGKQLGGAAGDLLKKGGAEAIGKGLGGVLETLFGKGAKRARPQDGTAER